MKGSNCISTILVIAFAGIALIFATYTGLQCKFPGKGVKVIQNVFKETTPFGEAITALQEGKRIRRKCEAKGFTRVIITEGKNITEKYGTYWSGRDDKKISEYCNFSVEDVLATDWIIDD